MESSKRQKMEIPLILVRRLRYCVGHGSGENAGVWCPRSEECDCEVCAWR